MKAFKEIPSQEFLQSKYDYDPETGDLIIRGGRYEGKVCSQIQKSGYKTVHMKGKTWLQHRVIWKYVTGEDPGVLYVDHIDGDRGNNRFSNLRLATPSQNQQDIGVSTRNKSGYRGVSYVKDKRRAKNLWRAGVCSGGRYIRVAFFPTAEEAARQYDQWVLELYGEFAKTNF